MSLQAPYANLRSVSAVTFDRIPAHWDAVRGRFLVRIRTGSGDTVDADPDGEYPFYVRSDTPLRSHRWVYDTHAVLTAGDGAGVAKVFHEVSGRFMAHQRVYVLDDFKRVNPRFFFYAFSSLFRLMALDGSAKSTVDSVRRNMIADMPIPVPELAEQQQIVDFLDSETARIDGLVAKQEMLVELLRERAAAFTVRSVFGLAGLDSDLREMRLLGAHRAVEPLLGHTPEHWSIRRFWALMDRVEERNLDGSWLMMSLKSSGDVVPRVNGRQEPGDASLPRYLRVRPDELVLNPMWLVGGAIGVSNVSGAVSPEYRVFRSRGEHDPRYLHHLLRTKPYLDQYRLYTRAQTTFDRRVQQAELNNLPLPVPPIGEQQRIAAHLDDYTAKNDLLIEKAERFIGFAKERRATLITAAVTGQIDVRKAA